MNTKLNKSDYILLFIYFAISVGMNAYGYYTRNAFTLEYLIDFPLEIGIIFLLMYLFMTWLIPSYFIKEKKYFLFAFWGLFVLFILGAIDYSVGFWTGQNNYKNFARGINFVFEGISNAANMMSFPFAILLTKKFYESQTQMVDIQKQQKENELKLLRSQLDPHFLFNNLNTLDALIDSNPTKAKEYINRLSLIYRYLIQTKDAEVMELIDELNLAENYIFLIQTRFGDDYDFTITKKTLLLDKFIPTGSIQTLLENVVKHNKAKNGNQIKTTILIGDEWLVITNTKSNTISNSSLGTGLQNLKTRYQLLSDKTILIEETDTTYKIAIPIIQLSTEA